MKPPSLVEWYAENGTSLLARSRLDFEAACELTGGFPMGAFQNRHVPSRLGGVSGGVNREDAEAALPIPRESRKRDPLGCFERKKSII
jgi:hypothetical protein